MIEAMKKRSSVRSYREEVLADEVKERIEKLLLTDLRGPFGNRTRFKLLDIQSMRSEKGISIGTYGVIKGAHWFIAGAVSRGKYCMEDYGYCLEEIILNLTNMGLGTCWLGGTFKRSPFTEEMELAEDEVLPAVTPVGYPASKQRILEKAMRFTAGAKKRKPWETLFFNGTPAHPLSAEEAGPYAEPVESLRWAPSASNKQPWRIIKAGERQLYHFYISRTMNYGLLGDTVSLQDIDMGIAMCHFDLAAREKGLSGVWLEQDPGITGSDLEYISSWKEAGE